MHRRRAALALPVLGCAGVRVVRIVQEGCRVTDDEAVRFEGGEARTEGNLHVDGHILCHVGAHRAIEAHHERARGGVICEGLPTDDGEMWEAADEALGECDGVAAIEDDAPQLGGDPASLRHERGNELVRGGEVDGAIRTLEDERAHQRVAREDGDLRVVVQDGTAHVLHRGGGLDKHVRRRHGAQQQLELSPEGELPGRASQVVDFAAELRGQLAERRVGEESE